jgi:drug/metabolite transporter (DMT)-like permease
MPLPSDAALGALAALGSACIWAVISLLVRRLSPLFNSLTLNALRSLVAGALLVGWVLMTRGAAELTSVTPWAFGMLALSIVIAVGIGDTLFFESARSLGLARAMTLSMTYPLIATLLAAVLVGEPITVPVIAGSALALGGLALIAIARQRNGHGPPEAIWPGIGTATLASVAWAVSVIALRPPLAEMDATTAQALRLPVAGALLFATPWTWGALPRIRASGPSTWWALAALGLLTSFSSVLFVAGLKYAGVAVATVLSSTAPMFAIPLGMIFLGERMAPAAIVGTVATVAGIAVLQL